MTASVAARSNIADPSLAGEGERRIEWARRHSPVLTKLARERLNDGTLRGRKVAVVVGEPITPAPGTSSGRARKREVETITEHLGTELQQLFDTAFDALPTR